MFGRSNTISVGDARPVISAEHAMRLMSEQRWIEAARCFRLLLATASDPPLWMQYGHALKESGFLEEARRAYARARELRPLRRM